MTELGRRAVIYRPLGHGQPAANAGETVSRKLDDHWTASSRKPRPVSRSGLLLYCEPRFQPVEEAELLADHRRRGLEGGRLRVAALPLAPLLVRDDLAADLVTEDLSRPQSV
jgi:hypothetical protein